MVEVLVVVGGVGRLRDPCMGGGGGVKGGEKRREGRGKEESFKWDWFLMYVRQR